MVAGTAIPSWAGRSAFRASLGMARAIAQAAGRRFLTPAKPVLANLVSIPLTVAGIGCVDTGVFLASHIAGWIVTGMSLMYLEHLIADDQAGQR